MKPQWAKELYPTSTGCEKVLLSLNKMRHKNANCAQSGRKKLICKSPNLHMRKMQIFNCSKNKMTILPHRHKTTVCNESVYKPFLLLASKGARAALHPLHCWLRRNQTPFCFCTTGSSLWEEAESSKYVAHKTVLAALVGWASLPTFLSLKALQITACLFREKHRRQMCLCFT